MPEPDIYLSVIVPAYNEASRLPKTLRRFQEYLSSQPFTYEITVVPDGPRDNTIEVAKKMYSEINNMRILKRSDHRGRGTQFAKECSQLKGKYAFLRMRTIRRI